VTPGQLSEGTGGAHKTPTASHTPESAETVVSEGQPVRNGSSSSVTVTSNSQESTFPAPSVAVYVTVVVPTGKKVPGGLETVTTTSPRQLSAAVGGVQVTSAPQTPPSLLCEIFIGHPEKTGASSSITVMVAVQALSLPLRSVTVRVTVLPAPKSLQSKSVSSRLRDAIIQLSVLKLSTSEGVMLASPEPSNVTVRS